MTASVNELWSASDAAQATGGKTVVDWHATGVSIDSRTLRPGDLFVALPGPNFDGHEYVLDALGRGAAASLISRKPKGISEGTPLLEVADTVVGLNQLGIAARARARARIIAVTGSVGKTSIKDALAVDIANDRHQEPSFTIDGNPDMNSFLEKQLIIFHVQL